MRVVYDTNVIVSSFLSPKGSPAKVIDLWKSHLVDLVVSEEILSEYQRALLYRRVQTLHRMTNDEIEEVIDDFRKFALVVTPTSTITVVKDDPDDNKFLECAEKGNASYLISGDPDLLRVGEYKGIQIFSPAAFLALLNEKP